MSAGVALETPSGAASIWTARNEDVSEFEARPAFTGDIYRLTDGRIVALVQHPCAMRRGHELTERLLICEVLPQMSATPSDWSRGHFKRMFLPGFEGENGESVSIEFEAIEVVSREELLDAERLAIMSAAGVNLLVQRWLFHNSRVVIPTVTINDQTTGPFDEADLIFEAVSDLTVMGFGAEEAASWVDSWLSEAAVEGGASRRVTLSDPQQRSAVRSSLRHDVRSQKK